MPAAEAPLYHRTYLLLRQRILSGQWEQGALFPTEQELCESMSISRVTVRRALEMLTEENLLRRFQGRGSIVVPAVMPQPVHASISGQISNAEDLGRRTSVALLSYGEVVPPAAIAAAFGCAPGDRLHRNVRLRSRQDAPVSHVTSWLTREIGARISRADLLTSRPILSTLQAMLTLAGADQTISAKLADEQVSTLLQLPLGAPLLEVTRTVASAEATTAMVSVALYNPELYQYRLRLDDPSMEPWYSEPHA
jgi:GntR family transcriptional regulator